MKPDRTPLGDLNPYVMIDHLSGLPTPLVLDTVDSTNRYLKELARTGAPYGTVVVADTQTAGRGRFDRRFASPPGAGIYLSCLVRGGVDKESLPRLTPYAAVSVLRGLGRVYPGVSVGIKWVNDLLVDGKKVCGILSEGAFGPDGTLEYAICGIGINIKQAPLPPDVASIATSMEEVGGGRMPRDRVIHEVLSAFYTHLSQVKTGEFLSLYREKSVLTGKTVTVKRGGETVRGTVLGIGEQGELLLATPQGETKVSFGEVVTLHEK